MKRFTSIKTKRSDFFGVSSTFLDVSFSVCFSPAIVAVLWDVTDRDIDRFTLALLDGWLGSHRELSDVIGSARDECKLPHLVGAAPVVYGLPVKCD